jgi:hypothetical protein
MQQLWIRLSRARDCRLVTLEARREAAGFVGNESVIASDASLLEHGETLTAQRMEWVTDLGPSQMLAVLKCSFASTVPEDTAYTTYSRMPFTFRRAFRDT